jgi:hypothetical protein
LIRFVHKNAPRFEPVQICQAKTSNPEYGVWCHHWQPKRRGGYWIEMKLGDGTVRARKMWLHSEIGRERRIAYHARAVDIPLV